MPTLYLQRHTRPDIDPKICYGQSDIELHPSYSEADLPKVIERLQGVKVPRIYSSTLMRCHRLATDLQATVGAKEVALDSRLMEMNFGDWELTPWDDIYATQSGKEWFQNYLHHKTPNGEAFIDVVDRAASLLKDIRLTDDTLVVTHGGFIRAMLVATQQQPLDRVFEVEINYGDLIEIKL
ncbi:MAG: histidine phosphatase family protein [Rikenellaceae bacterium]